VTLQRTDNVLVVVDDLEAAKAFFAELGMELEGEATNAGPWVDRVVGLDGVRSDLAMMRTPDGHGRVELAKFHTPPTVRAEPEGAPANTLGIRRIMFAVDDVDDVRSHAAELVGEIAQYEAIHALLSTWPPRASSSDWRSSSATTSMGRMPCRAGAPATDDQRKCDSGPTCGAGCIDTTWPTQASAPGDRSSSRLGGNRNACSRSHPKKFCDTRSS
jgi:catechol 2,3-dioxygenase-like lactoylglutathione lyase family enzyme